MLFNTFMANFTAYFILTAIMIIILMMHINFLIKNNGKIKILDVFFFLIIILLLISFIVLCIFNNECFEYLRSINII